MPKHIQVTLTAPSLMLLIRELRGQTAFVLDHAVQSDATFVLTTNGVPHNGTLLQLCDDGTYTITTQVPLSQ